MQANGSDHFVRHVPAHTKVRNIVVYDGRTWFPTANGASRHVTVRWSRVWEPELVGYNVYRTCSFFPVEFTNNYAMETFDCESAWVQLNTTPVPASQNYFHDATTRGMAGGFRYAVRPVLPGGVEGDIGKIVEADLFNYYWLFLPENVPSNPDFHGQAATALDNTSAPSPVASLTSVLLAPPNGINGKTIRGTGDPAGAPSPPTAVTRLIREKVLLSPVHTTKFAHISWTMDAPPSDLLGFYVETAGSPNGPWQRLNQNPIAWWERHYIIQGVGYLRSDCGSTFSGHTECLSYRVIAVDDAGNESQPANADNPLPNVCPATPAPPSNLRASTVETGTKLEWDEPPGATALTEYHVYRLIHQTTFQYFYDTKYVVGATSFIETGADAVVSGGTCPGPDCCYDRLCPFQDGQVPRNPMCDMNYLDAYYVTAANANEGESPRSNLVFWSRVDPSGYTSALMNATTTDAIAAIIGGVPEESLTCWLTDPTASDGLGMFDGDPPLDITPPKPLEVAPMLPLGLVDPAWMVLDLHTDHLGSVRAITKITGALVSRHDYFPFGEEITSQLSYNTHQYTGHEHDKETGLDYMLGRYYRSGEARFLSADPLFDVAHSLRRPARWNRYAYVLNNPLIYIDPSGNDLILTGSGAKTLLNEANAGLYGKKLVMDNNGDVTLQSDLSEFGPATAEQASLEETLNDAISDTTTTRIEVVSRDPSVGIDSYSGAKADIEDMRQFSAGPGPSTVGFIAHAIAEQHAKQSMGLADNEWGYSVAHYGFAIPAENGATGFVRGEEGPGLRSKNGVINGSTTIPYSQGGQVINVTITYQNGDIYGVVRK